MTGSLLNRGFASLLVGLLLVTSVVGSAGALQAGGPGLDFGDDKTPNPYIHEDRVEIAVHDRAEMSSPLQLYDDSGEVTTLPATYNKSQDLPVSVRFDQVDDEDWRQFPRKTNEENNTVSVIDASEWTTGGTNATKLSVTQTDSSTADGVKSISIATDGTMGTGDIAHASYNNFSLSDSSKRVLLLVGNVDTLDAGAEGAVQLHDADGDYVESVINSSESANATGVIADSTGSGAVHQVKLADLSLQGSGDGTLDDLEEIRVETTDGDVGVTLVALDAERKSKISLGETVRDEDGDGENETTTVEQRYAGGDMSLGLTSLDTMGSLFDDARLHNLEVRDLKYRFADLMDSDDYSVEFSDADAYQYPRKVTMKGRLSVPAYIDASHFGLSLRDDQGLVSERFVTAKYAEGTGDKEFADVSSWTSVEDAYSGVDETASYDTTVQTDTSYVFELVVTLTEEDETALKPATGGGGGFYDEGGNPLQQAFGWAAAALTGLVVFIKGFLPKMQG